MDGWYLVMRSTAGGLLVPIPKLIDRGYCWFQFSNEGYCWGSAGANP